MNTVTIPKRRNHEIKIPDFKKVKELTELAELAKLTENAEFGKRARIVFHDIANHMTSITLSMEYVASLLRTHVEKSSAEKEFFDPKKEIEKIISGFGSKFEKDNVVFNFTSTNGIEVFGNINSFVHIITNLISNALDSFDEDRNRQKEKKISIKLKKMAEVIQISVSDTGCGIQPELVDKIFESGFTTKTTGHGVGLTAVKEYVEKDFGGSIKVESSPLGSTFTITINLVR